MEYFDYRNTAHEAGITDDQLARIVAMEEREFPDSQMMCELHVLRVCMAVRDGRITLDQALAESDDGES